MKKMGKKNNKHKFDQNQADKKKEERGRGGCKYLTLSGVNSFSIMREEEKGIKQTIYSILKHLFRKHSV